MNSQGGGLVNGAPSCILSPTLFSHLLRVIVLELGLEHTRWCHSLQWTSCTHYPLQWMHKSLLAYTAGMLRRFGHQSPLCTACQRILAQDCFKHRHFGQWTWWWGGSSGPWPWCRCRVGLLWSWVVSARGGTVQLCPHGPISWFLFSHHLWLC